MAKKPQMPWKMSGADGPGMMSPMPGKGRRKGAGPPQTPPGRRMGPARKVDDSVKKMK